nr:MAG TPA: hypothetical protein [Microviridae sp.]
MITPEEKNLRSDLQKMLNRQGFKNSIVYTEVEGKGPGFLVALIDPVDSNSVFFCRFYTVDEVKTITTAQRIFWRYVK